MNRSTRSIYTTSSGYSSGQSWPWPVRLFSFKSRGSGRGQKAPQCRVEPPTPVPELLPPKAFGISPALRRSPSQ